MADRTARALRERPTDFELLFPCTRTRPRASVAFYALPLYGSLALSLAGHVFFKRRVLGSTSRERPVAVAVLLAAIAVGIVAPPLAAMASWSPSAC